MRLVIDASVAIKWMLGDELGEVDVGLARDLLIAIFNDGHELLQPPHWQSEIVGVMVRKYPGQIAQTIETLHAIGFKIADDDAIFLRAAEIASRLKHHLFDTLYHAVALEKNALLVTADEKYFAAARNEGSIQRLSSLKLG